MSTPTDRDGPARRRRRNLDKLDPFLAAAMPARRTILALPLLLSSLARPAAAQGYSSEVERVLGRAFAASGGAGWYRLRGWREAGRRAGLAYESWIDPLRYGLRTELREAGGLRIQGFNGQAEWEISPTGAITAVNDRATLGRARTEAFFAAHCYYFPGRFDARGDYLGVRQSAGRDFDVARIQPLGGDPRELWFDRDTRLLGRIVDRTGRREAALRVSDYRKVGPVLVPFRLTPESHAAAAAGREREEVGFEPLERERFSLERGRELARVEAARRD